MRPNSHPATKPIMKISIIPIITEPQDKVIAIWLKFKPWNILSVMFKIKFGAIAIKTAQANDNIANMSPSETPIFHGFKSFFIYHIF